MLKSGVKMKNLMFPLVSSPNRFWGILIFLAFFPLIIFSSQSCYAITDYGQTESEFKKESGGNQTQGKATPSVEMIERMIALNPEKVDVLINAASFYLDKKAYAKVEGLLKTAWEIDPRNGDTCLWWARLYRNQGEKEKAEKFFKKAIELMPENDNVYAELGKFYYQQGDLAKTEECYKKTLSVNPKNRQAGTGLKNILANEYKKKLLANPKDEKIAVKLGFVYIMQGKLTDAESMFSYVLRLNSQNDEALAGMGRLAMKRKDTLKAEEFFSKALQINPKNESAIQGIAQLSKLKESPSI